MKKLLKNAQENLRELINKRLVEINATETERLNAERELDIINKHNATHIFVFLYELTKRMKENDVYFNARGSFYTTFYCSYLLGFLEYNPLDFPLSYAGFYRAIEKRDLGNKCLSAILDVETGNHAKVIEYLKTQFSEEELVPDVFMNKDNELVSSEHVFNLTTAEFSFKIELMSSPLEVLDRIKAVEKENPNIDYANFRLPEVYEYMQKNELIPPFFDLKNIALNKPYNIYDLANCQYNVVNVTEYNIGHHICYAVLYYKLAYIDKNQSKQFEL